MRINDNFYYFYQTKNQNDKDFNIYNYRLCNHPVPR